MKATKFTALVLAIILCMYIFTACSSDKGSDTNGTTGSDDPIANTGTSINISDSDTATDALTEEVPETTAYVTEETVTTVASVETTAEPVETSAEPTEEITQETTITEPEYTYPAEIEESDPTLWKEAYISYIEERGSKTMCDYRLVYVDSDDIPELFISGSCEAEGSIICTYKNGEVLPLQLNRIGGCMFIPYSGLVYNFNGNMGYYPANVYQLVGDDFISLFQGLNTVEFKEVTDASGETSFEELYTYIIYSKNDSEKTVTEDEFYAEIKKVFDISKADALYYYNDSRMYSYEGITELILNW